MLGSEIWVMLVAAIAGIALPAVVVTIIRDRAGEPEDVTIGFLGPTLAAIYLLVLAFALVTEWQTNADARQSVVNEATALRGLQWSAPGLPASSAATLHRQLDAYLSQVVHHDRVAGHGWPAGGPRSGRGSGGVPAQPGLRWPARRRSRGDRGRGPAATGRHCLDWAEQPTARAGTA